MVFYVLFVIALAMTGSQSQSPVIFSSPTVNVMEGGNLTVTCTYNASQTIDTLRRLQWKTTGVVSEISFSKNCISFSVNRHLVTCNISGTNIYTLQLILTSNLYLHDDTVTCEVQLNNLNPRQADAVIFITVPVKTADLIQPTSSEVSVIEGTSLELRCTSDGRPRPTIEWYKQKDTEPEIPIPGGNNTHPSELGTESVLLFYPNRSDNDYILYCKAYNIDPVVHKVSLHKPLLNVLYPSTKPTLTYFAETSHTITTDTINVISGYTFSIGCKADGNPLPVYHWDNSQHANSNITIENIQHDLSLMHSCTALSIMNPTYGVNVIFSTTANISFNVMYVPSLPTLYYEHERTWERITTSTIQVIEHTPFTVKCDSSIGNPPDVMYHWQGNVGKNFTLRDININHSRQYTCSVTNVLQRTFGAQEIGHTSTTITVNVLYPPLIHTIADMKIEEGSNVIVTCNIVKGNPENANFSWSYGLTNIALTATLEINHVTRNKSGVYECVVYNMLQPTYGSMKNGSDSESFHLDVLYKSSIKELYARTDDRKSTTITIDELDSINLYCSVDSNPYSNIEIRHNEQQTVMQTNVENINHFVESAACDDAGIFTCTGYNPHIQDQSRDTADIIVYVRCFPRASKSIEAIKAIALNDTLHFTVTLVAYPVPRDEDYIWHKQLQDTSWVQLNTTDRITISTSHLKTSLFIININHQDYGNYSLTVSNNVANDYYQVFGVIPYVLADKSMEQSNTNVVGIVVGSVVGCIVFLVFGIVIGIGITRRKHHPALGVCCFIKDVKQKEDNHVYYNTTQTNTEVTTEETETNGPIIEETVDRNAYEQMVSTNRDEKVYTELKYDDHDGIEHVEPEEPAKIYINLKIQDTSS